MNTNRRDFLKGASLGLTGVELAGNAAKAEVRPSAACEHTIAGAAGGGNPRDVKLNVKLIYYAMIHSTIWEGPCRYSEMTLGPDAERADARKKYAETVKRFRSSLPPEANMLEPVYLEFHENTRLLPRDLSVLKAGMDQVDLYVLRGYNLSSHHEVFFASALNEMCKTPIVGAGHFGRTVAAYLDSMGAEGYADYAYGGLNKLIALLRARKAFRQTNMLLVTAIGGALKGPGYLRGSVRDFDDLKNKFGIGTTIVSYSELTKERDRILKNPAAMREVERVSDRLLNQAKAVHMDRELFKNNVLFYQTIRALMAKHNCNAYSIDCIEFCSSKLPMAWKITPCVAFSLCNGEGYATACEGEIGCLLAMKLFSAIASKSAYMGNLNPYRPGPEPPFFAPYFWVNEAVKGKADFTFGHNVPTLKMEGFETPDLPFEIRNYIPGKPGQPGWGASFKVDFTKIKEKTITLGRFNPATTKLLLTRAEVVGMRGFASERCSTETLIRVKDPDAFHLRTATFGHHHVMVYGDYTQELSRMADILKVECILHAP
jgi:L-fucose isomerase-like protein